MTEPTEDMSTWMSRLSPATLELAYEFLERQKRRQAFLENISSRRVAVTTQTGAVTVETSYLLLPHKVELREHSAFSPYLTHALRRTAQEARRIRAEEEEVRRGGFGVAAAFFPTVPEEDSLADPGEFPEGMRESGANPELAEEFRQFVRAQLDEEPPTRPVGRSTLSLSFATPRGELGVTVDRLGLPTDIFSGLARQHSESVVWMAHEGARRMRGLLREETRELRRGTFELADLADGAPKFADLDRQEELPGLVFPDKYEQERHDKFVASLREVKDSQ